jgi:hypothetical protein
VEREFRVRADGEGEYAIFRFRNHSRELEMIGEAERHNRYGLEMIKALEIAGFWWGVLASQVPRRSLGTINALL